MHYCTRPKAECNSASGRPRYLGVIVWLSYKQAWNNCFITQPICSVPWMELLKTMRFCCKTENFTKYARFWSQNVPLVLRKRVPTLYVSDHKQLSYWSLKLPNHAPFSPLLHNVSFHKGTVRTMSSRMIISACVVLTGKRETRHMV